MMLWYSSLKRDCRPCTIHVPEPRKTAIMSQKIIHVSLRCGAINSMSQYDGFLMSAQYNVVLIDIVEAAKRMRHE